MSEQIILKSEHEENTSNQPKTVEIWHKSLQIFVKLQEKEQNTYKTSQTTQK